MGARSVYGPDIRSEECFRPTLAQRSSLLVQVNPRPVGKNHPRVLQTTVVSVLAVSDDSLLKRWILATRLEIAGWASDSVLAWSQEEAEEIAALQRAEETIQRVEVRPFTPPRSMKCVHLVECKSPPEPTRSELEQALAAGELERQRLRDLLTHARDENQQLREQVEHLKSKREIDRALQVPPSEDGA
jgi:hypothetical protein